MTACSQPKVRAAQYELVISMTGAQLCASSRIQSPPRDFASAIPGSRIGIPGSTPQLMMTQTTSGTLNPLAAHARNSRRTGGRSASKSRRQ